MNFVAIYILRHYSKHISDIFKSKLSQFFSNQSFLSILSCSSRCRYPFDWKNPYGYFFAFATQCVTMFYVNYLITIVLATGIGFYMLIMSLSNDIKSNLESINAMTKRKKNHLELLNHLKCSLHYHSNAMQLSVYLFLFYVHVWQWNQVRLIIYGPGASLVHYQHWKRIMIFQKEEQNFHGVKVIGVVQLRRQTR